MGHTTKRTEGRTRPARLALAMLLGIAALGCGSLTAGGFGEATVVMSGDAPDETPQATSTAPQPAVVGSEEPAAGAPRTASASPEEAPLPTSHDGDPKGDLQVELSVFLVAADGDMAALTDGMVQVQLDLDGVQEPEIGSTTVPARSYTGLRMVFREVAADVESGLIIGGEIVTGLIDVAIGDATLPVTKDVSVEIAEGDQVELLIDLNADSWLQAVDLLTRTVDAQVFADRVAVAVR